jgi:signal transduction histidine kinase
MNILSSSIEIGLIVSAVFGVIYLILWANQVGQPAHLFFAFSAFSVSTFAWIELQMSHSATIAGFVTYRHWAHICSLFIIVSFALFIKTYLRAGRTWLLLLAVGMRALSSGIDLQSAYSINYSEIFDIRQVVFLGESISVVDGISNPLMVIAQISLILYVAFCFDAAFTVWRRGEKRLAVTMGGSIVVFSTGSLIMAVLVNWRVIDLPLIVSPFFMGTVFIMAYELTVQVIRAHELSGRLIAAQEAERSRLARELHDDLSQSLALLSIEVDTLSSGTNEDDAIEERMGVLSERIRHISSDIHRISHSLHPALLQQLGLVTAIGGFCRELQKNRGLQITINAAELSSEPSDEVALCLFRITQESLQNVAKHSESSTATVDIAVHGKEIRLTVTDEGKGFDPRSKIVQDSIGLVSMQERIWAVNGSLTIDSKPGKGTRITARVPIA